MIIIYFLNKVYFSMIIIVPDYYYFVLTISILRDAKKKILILNEQAIVFSF